MISKSRLTASSSKPVPQPTVNALVEEAEAIGKALELGRAAANIPVTDGEVAQDSAEEADTDVAAAEEEACGEATHGLGWAARYSRRSQRGTPCDHSKHLLQ